MFIANTSQTELCTKTLIVTLHWEMLDLSYFCKSFMNQASEENIFFFLHLIIWHCIDLLCSRT